MSAARLRELLLSRGREWPAALESFEVLDSTNDVMRERAKDGAAPWSAVVADRQSAGRGRRGRAWASPPGNLYLSVLAGAPSQPRWRPLVPLVGGLAVAEALAEFGVEAGLKWPNDVLAGGRKLAGVSAEASFGGGGPEWIVLGVGVNVGVNPGTVDPGLVGRATSILELTGAAPDRLAVAAALLIRLHDRHAELEAGAGGALLDAWRARSVAWWGRAVEVVSGEQALRGVALGVDDGGALLLRLADGRTETILAGEARELRLDE